MVLQGFATVSDTVSDTAAMPWRCGERQLSIIRRHRRTGQVPSCSERRRLRVVRFIHRFGLRINNRQMSPRCQGVPRDCLSFPLERGVWEVGVGAAGQSRSLRPRTFNVEGAETWTRCSDQSEAQSEAASSGRATAQSGVTRALEAWNGRERGYPPPQRALRTTPPSRGQNLATTCQVHWGCYVAGGAILKNKRGDTCQRQWQKAMRGLRSWKRCLMAWQRAIRCRRP